MECVLFRFQRGQMDFLLIFCKRLYIELRKSMEQPIATVHVNMGDHLPRPEIKIYPQTDIPNTIRKFMQRYDLPDPVFEAMLNQIQQSLIANGVILKDLGPNTSEFTPTSLQTQLPLMEYDNNANVTYCKKQKVTKNKQQNLSDTPFDRLFTSDENEAICNFTERKPKKKYRKGSKSGMQKKSPSMSVQRKNNVKKKKENQLRISDLSLMEKDQKVRQFFKFLARKNNNGLLTFNEVSRLQTKTPRLANTLSKLFKKGKKEWLDEQKFVTQAGKLKLTQHLSRDISIPKLIKTNSPNSQ